MISWRSSASRSTEISFRVGCHLPLLNLADLLTARRPLHSSSYSHEYCTGTACAPLRVSESRLHTLIGRYACCLYLFLVASCVRTHHSLSTTTEHPFRALHPLLCAKSVSICYTNPCAFPMRTCLLLWLVNWFNVDQQPDGLESGNVFRKKKHVVDAVQ
jgi:hypothetical protein